MTLHTNRYLLAHCEIWGILNPGETTPKLKENRSNVPNSLLNGILHREEGPALKYYDKGDAHWYYNNQLHRDDDLPAIESISGYWWYQHGLKHRDNNLPASIRFNRKNILDRKEWWKNGLYHRENGPAIEYRNGYHEWWIYGEQYTEVEFNQIIAKKNLNAVLQIELINKSIKPKVKI